MITLRQFNLLEEGEKATFVCKQGVFIGDRAEDDVTVLLYQVHSFYVEVYYKWGINKIQMLRSLITTNQLDPYLEQIDSKQIAEDC
jgi:hypothetical protein